MGAVMRKPRVPNVRTKPVLAVDWDGTCVPSAYPAQPREWLPGAVDALHDLSKVFRIRIYTARIAPVAPDEVSVLPPEVVAGEINYIREMLDDAGLTMVDIHTSPWKVPAFAYVDDRAERYTGRPGSWKAMKEKLMARVEAGG